MSRSRRNTPIIGIASGKKGLHTYRQARSGIERMYERILTHEAMLGDEYAAEDLESEQNPWDEWDCPRDGKQWLGSNYPKLMRK